LGFGWVPEVVDFVVKAAADAPSHAVVSTMKLPFLSLHLLQFIRQPTFSPLQTISTVHRLFSAS